MPVSVPAERARAAVAGAGVLAALAGLAVLGPAGPVSAARPVVLDSVLCDNVGDEVVDTTDPSAAAGPAPGRRTPRRCWAVPPRAGAGVNVAVLDSGVSRQGGRVRVVEVRRSRAAARSRTRTARPSRP